MVALHPKIEEYFNNEVTYQGQTEKLGDRYHRLLMMRIESPMPMFLGPTGSDSKATYGRWGISVSESSELDGMAERVKGICDALDLNSDWFPIWVKEKSETVRAERKTRRLECES